MMDAQTSVTSGSDISLSAHRHAAGRGRGRARAKALPPQAQQASPAPVRNADSCNNHKHPHPGESAAQSVQPSDTTGRFEDAVAGLAISNTPHMRQARSADVQNSLDENIPRSESDKENSSSPRVQRSRRAVFDTTTMSRINNHLLKSSTERGEGVKVRSLDRQKGGVSLSSSRISLTPEKALPARAQGVDGLRHTDAVSRVLEGEGRPRSMTDPVPLSAASPGRMSPGHRADASHPVMSTSTPLPPASQKPLLCTASASPPLSRVKGRGRGRARARSKQEMDKSLPGSGARHDALDLENCEVHVQTDKNSDRDRFADADHGNALPRPKQRPDKDSAFGEPRKGMPLESHSDVHPSSLEQLSKAPATASDSQATPGGGEGGSGPGRGLSLKIEVREQSPVLASPEINSPLADDITLLLSPNHEYTLDWAAAMATPTPDTSSDSAPDWSLADRM